MAEKRASAIRLMPPPVRANTGRFDWLLHPLLAWVLFVGFGGCMLQTFSLPCIGWAIALAALGVQLGWESMAKNPRKLFIAFLAATVRSLLLWALTARYTRVGIELVSNAMTRLASIRDLRILPAYEIKLDETLQPVCVTLLLIPPALLLALLCGVAMRYAMLSLPLALIGTAFAAMAYYRQFGAAVWLAPVFLVLCHMICRKNMRYGQTMALLFPMAALFLAVGVFSLLSGGAPAVVSERFEAERVRIAAARHGAKYHDESAALPEGRLRGFERFSPSDETALTLNGADTGSLYLRGYVGAVPVSYGWDALDGEALYEERSLFYQLHRAGFYPERQLFLLAKALGTADSDDLREITVSTDGACSAVAYLPHELAEAPDELLGVDRLGDGSLPAKKNDPVTYRILPHVAAQYPALAARLRERTGIGDADVDAYLDAENIYRALVYENYTGIPDELREVFDLYLDGGAEIGDTHLAYDDAKDAVLGLLGEHLTLTDTPVRTFDGSAESLEAILEGEGDGSCVQYASLAALLLRYWGIPARYAEGYLLTSADAAALTDGEPYELPMSRAHAWAEYYHDGVGWIPFEVTPGISEQMDELLELPQPEEEPDPNRPDRPEKPEKDPPADEAHSLSPVLPLGILLLLIALWFAIRWFVLKKREETFSDNDKNEAVRAIVRHLLVLLRAQGMEPSEASLSSLVSQLPEEATQEYLRAIELANLAAFSGRAVTEEERQEARELLNRFVALCEKTQSRPRRLLLRYGMWLY